MSSDKNFSFLFPGMMGQDSNPLLSSIDLMSKTWQNFAQGPQGNNAFAINPTLSQEDLDKRIQELKTVEGWLKLNLSMLSSTIQGLEIQRASMSAVESFAKTFKSQAESFSFTPPSGAADSAETTPEEKSELNQNMTDASQAWWNMIQNQFNQIAQATSATFANNENGEETPAAQAAAEPPAPVKKPTSRARKTPNKS